ncbi:hypothetical protein Hanom_Chr16g01513941 [Helianthus anomalus]
MELTSRMKMSRFQTFLDPDVEKQTFGRKSQNWPNVRDKNCILLEKNQAKSVSGQPNLRQCSTCSEMKILPCNLTAWDNHRKTSMSWMVSW